MVLYRALRMLIALLLVTGTVSVLAQAGATDPAGEAAKKPAMDAALAWLKIVDGGKQVDAWKAAAELFRKNVPKDQWKQAYEGIRAPLGAVVKRDVASQTYSTTMPGSPDGEYVVIYFTTAFANKASATEMVIPMREKDGTWRVAAYLLQ